MRCSARPDVCRAEDCLGRFRLASESKDPAVRVPPIAGHPLGRPDYWVVRIMSYGHSNTLHDDAPHFGFTGL